MMGNGMGALLTATAKVRSRRAAEMLGLLSAGGMAWRGVVAGGIHPVGNGVGVELFDRPPALGNVDSPLGQRQIR
jgi:hypothetical protein